MLEMAWGCGAGLVVKIVPFSELLKEYEKPFEANFAPSIFSNSESEKLQTWADTEDIDIGIDDNNDEDKVEGEITNVNVATSPKFAKEPVKQAESGHFTLGFITEVPTLEQAGLSNTSANVSNIRTESGKLRRAS